MNKKHIHVLIVVVILLAVAVSIHLIANSAGPGGILEMLKKLHGN